MYNHLMATIHVDIKHKGGILEGSCYHIVSTYHTAHLYLSSTSLFLVEMIGSRTNVLEDNDASQKMVRPEQDKLERILFSIS